MDAIVEERWREERRGRILDAASRVFGRLSYREASMDEIAQEAGVGKPTLYRYFPGKDSLFAAVFVEALDDLEARLDAVLDGRAAFGVQLSALVAEIAPMFRDHLVSRRLIGEGAAALDLSKRRIFRERRVRIERCLARAIETGIARGEVRAPDPARVAQFVIGMVWSATASSDRSAAEISHDVVEFAMTGLLPREADMSMTKMTNPPDDHPAEPSRRTNA